jgi:secondary thiamine-phosphate synthase enzyme
MGRRQKMAVSLFVSEKEATTLRVASDLVHLRSEERQQFIDITELVRERVRRARVSDGWVNIQTRHTTTAVAVNEKEPLLLDDLESLLESWAPEDRPYRHNDLEARRFQGHTEERPNGHAHARAFVLGASETLNIMDGELQLGEWQSIFLVELDGIRTRGISIVVMGTPSVSTR